MQGCVYEMSRDAYEALWRSEGGAMKKTPYQEVVVSVRDPSTRTRRRRDHVPGQRPGPPSDATASRPRYLGIIEEGARELH